jgi:hypothetical protein
MKRILFFLFLALAVTACERNDNRDDFILKYYGDVRENIATGIAAATDGYVISGRLTEVKRNGSNYITGSSDRIGLIRTLANGNLEWKKLYGGRLQGLASKVIVLPDGKIVCTGYVVDTVANTTDLFVLRTEAGGDEEIFSVIKKTGNQTGTDILKTPSGYIVLGTTDVQRSGTTLYNGNQAGKTDIMLTFLNDNLAETQSSDGKGYVGNDRGAALKEDPSGGFIVVGTTDYTPVGPSSNNIIIVKVNDVGSVTEPVVIGGGKEEFVSDFEVLPGGYLISGTIGPDNVKQVPFILRLTSDITAAPVFMKELENENSRKVSAMCRYRNNYFVFAGKEGSASLSKNLFFVTDAEGNPVPEWEMVSGSDAFQETSDVVSDINGFVIGVGRNATSINSLISLLKFRF